MNPLPPCKVEWCCALAAPEIDRGFCAVHAEHGKALRPAALGPGEEIVDGSFGDCGACRGSGDCDDCGGGGECGDECGCGHRCEHDCEACKGTGQCQTCGGSGRGEIRIRKVA